eukprot:c17619_g1_i1.p1 GENE.c17619_g1_i1~~c17619_g1_i1.p1  ORF type:complete len:350 (-),score=80.18 c17619_g1_i1:86-1105(-)
MALLECKGTILNIHNSLYGIANASWPNHSSTNPQQPTDTTANIPIAGQASIKISTFGTTDVISKHLLELSAWEQPLMLMTELLSAHFQTAKQAMVFLDIGSNLGLFGLIAASYGHVTFFFEPVAATVNHLCQSVEMNGLGAHTRVFPFGLGSKRQTIEMATNQANYGASTMRHESVEALKLSHHTPTVLVPTAALDDIFQELNVDPKARLIVKIDAEGFEHDILLGGKKTLLQNPNVDAIFFENTWGNSPAGESADWQWLKEHFVQNGFGLYCCMNCATTNQVNENGEGMGVGMGHENVGMSVGAGRCLAINVSDFESTRKYSKMVAVKSNEILDIISS